MIVYFVRHGESVAASKGVYQGDDDPLSQLGIKQAQTLGDRLKTLSIERIYSSPFKRARLTAEIISKKINKVPEVWEELQETRNPKEIVGKPLGDAKSKKIKKLIKDNYQKGNWKYSDEETFEELNARAKQVLKRLTAVNTLQNILCVSHAGIIKMILAQMIFGENLTPQIYWNFKYHLHSDNTGIIVCKYSEKAGWVLTAWNDTAHL